MTEEELCKKLANVFGIGCLSEDRLKCEYNGECDVHEKVKALEAIEGYSKQLRVNVIDEVHRYCCRHLHFFNSNEQMELYRFLERLKEQKNELV